MKKVIIMILVLALCLSMFAGCGSDSDVAFEDKYDTLYLYTEVGFPPFEYYDGDTAVGVDIEIGQAIADKLGWDLVVYDVPFDGIVSGLTAENAIAAAGMTITEERELMVDFSEPYYISGLAVIAKTGSIELGADGSVPASSLDGLVIGTQTGTTGDSYVYNYVDAALTKGYQNVLLGMQDIGDVLDVFVIDTLPADVAVLAYEGYTAYPLADVEADPYGIAVSEGNSELLAIVQAVLDEMEANGEIDALIAYHKESVDLSE
ncbi:MAG: ABC transporter substrate-binding protein [Bacillota bacterium]